jgi:glycosyltransferase involved in cell wall biosynthesis
MSHLMQFKPVISIVMPVRNEGERVAKAILSFSSGRSRLFPMEFVIVDDVSSDGCCNALEELLTLEKDAVRITVIRLDSWSGIPFARNIGAANAQSPILFITDANVEACQRWDIPVFRDLRPKRALCAAIAEKGSSWIGYGCLLDLPTMGVKWLSDPRDLGGIVPVSPCTGTVLPAALFRKLGGYDTAMPAYGAAEPEFSVRLWLYGAEIIICPDLVLTHRFRPSEERRPFLDQIESIQIKNYIRFAMLYLDNNELTDVLNHYSKISPMQFKKALHELQNDPGLGERRSHLQKELSKDFNWYLNKFNYSVMY